MRLIGYALALVLLSAALPWHPGEAIAQEPPRVVLFEDPQLDENRLHYPLLISGERGYRIRCETEADEEAIIRGLGFNIGPSAILSAVSPEIIAARPDENPLLCPLAPNYQIKVFAARTDEGLAYYLQFPAGFGETTVADRLYTPGCAELIDALGLDLNNVIDADPTPFFVGKIHEVACLTGSDLVEAPDTFSEWCMYGERDEAQTATVMALLDATPVGVGGIGNAAACADAGAFLGSVANLNLNDRGVRSLEPLKSLIQLTSLSLADNGITDIAPLTKLTALSFLDLSGNKVDKVIALAPLTALTRLSLNDNEIAEVRSLSALAALTELKLDNNAVSDLAPLQFLAALTRLSLAGNELTGGMLEPLTALGSLQELNLANNKIADFETLGAFPSTLVVNLSGNPIVTADAQTFLNLCILHRDDATPFGQTIRAILELHEEQNCQEGNALLMATTTLDLSSKIISDIRPLAVLTHLTSLNLSSNAITDVSPLSDMVGLTSLNIAGNQIADIRPIAPLRLLTTFEATGNPVLVTDFLSACLMRTHPDVLSHEQSVEVDALLAATGETKCQDAADDLAQRHSLNVRDAGLTSLDYFGILTNIEAIDLSGNGLNGVAPLQLLPALKRIVARGNNIASLSSLRPMRNLEELYLDGNPISNLIGLGDLSKLRRLGLSNTGVRSIMPIADLPFLESAELRNLPLNYDSFREYCIVKRFDGLALGSVHSFMAALEGPLQAAHVDLNDCIAVESWVSAQTTLTLNKKSITAVDPIVYFTALEELQLFDNLIVDATPIASLSNLTKLNLATNRMGTVPRFGSVGLRQLYLNDNFIANLSPLTNLSSLTGFDARGNRIESILPLTANGALTSIDIRNNRIDIGGIDNGQLAKTYLGANPICGSVFVQQGVHEACEREPIRFFPVDIGNIVLEGRNLEVLNCGNGGLCPQIRVQPHIISPLVNP